MSKVLVLGMFRFPNGDAPANRMYSLAKSLVVGGIDVFVIGNGVPEECRGRMVGDREWNKRIESTSIRSVNDSYLARAVRRIFRTFYFARAIRTSSLGEIRVIVTNRDTLSLGLFLFCHYVLRRPLIIDSTEWFEPKQFRFGVISLGYLSFLWKFFVLTPLAGNVIAVSRCLSKHFATRCHATIRVPPQVDAEEYSRHSERPAEAPLELFYAGTAARKDYVHVAVEGLSLLTAQELGRIRFTVLGPSRAEVYSGLAGRTDEIDRVSKSIDMPGRVSRDEVLHRLAKAHFLVLLRPLSRYATAGFPSKVPESLAAGTGVIGNTTSDLAEYLQDGVNSLIVPECTPEAFAYTVRRALGLSGAQLQEISVAARRSAVENFDYRVHSDSLCQFVRSVGRCA